MYGKHFHLAELMYTFIAHFPGYNSMEEKRINITDIAQFIPAIVSHYIPVLSCRGCDWKIYYFTLLLIIKTETRKSISFKKQTVQIKMSTMSLMVISEVTKACTEFQLGCAVILPVSFCHFGDCSLVTWRHLGSCAFQGGDCIMACLHGHCQLFRISRLRHFVYCIAQRLGHLLGKTSWLFHYFRVGCGKQWCRFLIVAILSSSAAEAVLCILVSDTASNPLLKDLIPKISCDWHCHHFSCDVHCLVKIKMYPITDWKQEGIFSLLESPPPNNKW